MTYIQITACAEKTLAYLRSAEGKIETDRLADKYGYSDGWMLSYTTLKVCQGKVIMYEDLTAIVKEIQRTRRAEAVARRAS